MKTQLQILGEVEGNLDQAHPFDDMLSQQSSERQIPQKHSQARINVQRLGADSDNTVPIKDNEFKPIPMFIDADNPSSSDVVSNPYVDSEIHKLNKQLTQENNMTRTHVNKDGEEKWVIHGKKNSQVIEKTKQQYKSQQAFYANKKSIPAGNETSNVSHVNEYAHAPMRTRTNPREATEAIVTNEKSSIRKSTENISRLIGNAIQKVQNIVSRSSSAARRQKEAENNHHNLELEGKVRCEQASNVNISNVFDRISSPVRDQSILKNELIPISNARQKTLKRNNINTPIITRTNINSANDQQDGIRKETDVENQSSSSNIHNLLKQFQSDALSATEHVIINNTDRDKLIFED